MRHLNLRRVALSAGLLASIGAAGAVPAGGQSSSAQCSKDTYGASPGPAETRPVSRFGYAPVNPVAGASTTFDASRSSDDDGDPIVTYYWDFGDGTGVKSATRAQITHSFGAAGVYTVQSVVVDCRDTPSAVVAARITVGAPSSTPARGGSSQVSVQSVTSTGVNLLVACTSAKPCTGSGVLSTRVRRRGRRVLGLSAARRGRARRSRTVIGSGRYRIAAGRASAVTVKLNPTGRRLLRRFGRIPARLTVSRGRGRFITLRVTIRGRRAHRRPVRRH